MPDPMSINLEFLCTHLSVPFYRGLTYRPTWKEAWVLSFHRAHSQETKCHSYYHRAHPSILRDLHNTECLFECNWVLYNWKAWRHSCHLILQSNPYTQTYLQTTLYYESYQYLLSDLDALFSFHVMLSVLWPPKTENSLFPYKPYLYKDFPYFMFRELGVLLLVLAYFLEDIPVIRIFHYDATSVKLLSNNILVVDWVTINIRLRYPRKLLCNWWYSCVWRLPICAPHSMRSLSLCPTNCTASLSSMRTLFCLLISAPYTHCYKLLLLLSQPVSILTIYLVCSESWSLLTLLVASFHSLPNSQCLKKREGVTKLTHLTHFYLY